jgi:hypothetical protein
VLLLVVAAVVGLVVAGTDRTPTVPGDDATVAMRPSDRGTTAAPTPNDPGAEASTDALPEDTVAAWTRSRLPEGFAEAVADDPGFAYATLVRAGTHRLVRTMAADGTVVDELPDGWWYPVELLALDPRTYDDVIGQPLVADLAADEVLLSGTSAEVRGLDVGGTLVFEDGTELRVAAVVPDELVGAGEILVRADGPLAPDRERYVLVRPAPELGDRDAVEARLTELLPEQRSLGTVALGEQPVLRHGAGVTAPVRMKAHYGEFAMRETGRGLQPGFSWIEEHITTEVVPILGRVECHRDMFEPLRTALQELVDRGLAHTIDPGDYGGCWVARTQGGEQALLSSHSWGVSIDVNVSGNHLGTASTQDPVLVEVMARHGFVWGGDWLLPDPMHFELAPDRVVTVSDGLAADDD